VLNVNVKSTLRTEKTRHTFKDMRNSARRHHQNNRESRRAKARDWYLANRDRKQAKAKEWMKANRDRFRKYYQSYQQQNRDKINQYLDEYRKTEQGRLVAQKRRIRRRARKAENHSSDYSHNDLRDRLQVFGGLCSYCLSSRGTSIDHFIPVSRGGSDALGNLLPCCKSCNSSKHNADPLEWYSRQSFFDRRQWLKILKLLGKSEGTYTQIPLL
jgi:5-methylcytosine-specific restriction endonuclease McrA